MDPNEHAVEWAARALCNDFGARVIADAIEAPWFDDSERHVQEYWLRIATAAAALTPAAVSPSAQGGAVEVRARKLEMPNGEVLECEYPDDANWARSWSIRYPDTNQIGTTGEQDDELVERYGLTALFDAFARHRQRTTPTITEDQRERAVVAEAAKPFVRHYAPWMDDWADDDECSTFARVTFGQLRALRAAIAGERG